MSQQVERLAHGRGRGIRPKVSGAVPLHAPYDLDAWIVLLPGDLDVWVTLVVLQADIVARTVLLDESTLENECFEFRVGDEEIQVGCALYEALDLGGVGSGSMEVGAYPIVEVDRFAHVEDFVGLSFHQVHSRPCGYKTECLLDVGDGHLRLLWWLRGTVSTYEHTFYTQLYAQVAILSTVWQRAGCRGVSRACLRMLVRPQPSGRPRNQAPCPQKPL
jgi:hypothetical protein